MTRRQRLDYESPETRGQVSSSDACAKTPEALLVQHLAQDEQLRFVLLVHVLEGGSGKVVELRRELLVLTVTRPLSFLLHLRGMAALHTGAYRAVKAPSMCDRNRYRAHVDEPVESPGVFRLQG